MQNHAGHLHCNDEILCDCKGESRIYLVSVWTGLNGRLGGCE